jgi:cell division protein ZapE
MLNTHKSLDELRKTNLKRDTLALHAKNLYSKYDVFIFDELQINNIADAMIVGRLFEKLIKNGCYVFFSSNRVPSDLFLDGLQRERFLPFISLITEKLDVFQLDNFIDYRVADLNLHNNVYFHPLSKKAEFYNLVTSICGEIKCSERLIVIDQNHNFKALKACGSLAIFSFNELCESPLGSIDYFAIGKEFNIIALENIPVLGPDKHNEALRFITLIDCLYENGNKIIFLAEDDAENLYQTGRNKFEFARTISRINEIKKFNYHPELKFSAESSD